MYTWELSNYIQQRNHELNSEEIIFVTDIRLHSQIVRITYNSWNNSYDMWDFDGTHLHFRVRK